MTDDAKPGLRLLEADDPAGGLIAYAMKKGEMDEAILDAVYKRFDDAAAAGTKLRIYTEIEGIPSMDASMILDKLKRLGTLMSALERMAIVGDAGWLDVYVKIMDPLTKPDMKHFATDEKDEALAWARG
jgi:hypothetical protein